MLLYSTVYYWDLPFWVKVECRFHVCLFSDVVEVMVFYIGMFDFDVK